jgi:hypothetical protein
MAPASAGPFAFKQPGASVDTQRVIALSGLRIVALLVGLVVVGLLWRTGIPFQGGDTETNRLLSEASPSPGDAARANVQGAVPAVEAYFAQNGTYEGLNLTAIDPASAAAVTVVSATTTSYCIQSTSGTETYSQHGPAGAVLPGPC